MVLLADKEIPCFLLKTMGNCRSQTPSKGAFGPGESTGDAGLHPSSDTHLLEYAVQGFWAADIKADEHGI